MSDDARCYLRHSKDFKYEPRSKLLEHLTKANFTDPDPTFGTIKEGVPGNACHVSLNQSLFPSWIDVKKSSIHYRAIVVQDFICYTDSE